MSSVHYSRQDKGVWMMRVALALIFFVHGAATLSDLEYFVRFAASVHIPSFLAYLVPIVEIAGSVAILFGACVRLSALLFAMIMVVVMTVVKRNAGFFGFELELLLLLLSCALLVSGPGTITFGNSRKSMSAHRQAQEYLIRSEHNS